VSDERKKSVENALHNYLKKYQKDTDKLNGVIKKRTNAKPEKNVEKECLTWMRAQGWNVQIFESKATQINGVWRNQSMKAGNADCQGTLPGGIACYIEFKSPGRLSTFNAPKNQRQIDFILAKIDMGAFACVVDSADHLAGIYNIWKEKRAADPEDAKNYLLDALP
jgi:GTP-binding protein EngB required for normal cell division